MSTRKDFNIIMSIQSVQNLKTVSKKVRGLVEGALAETGGLLLARALLGAALLFATGQAPQIASRRSLRLWL